MATHAPTNIIQGIYLNYIPSVNTALALTDINTYSSTRLSHSLVRLVLSCFLSRLSHSLVRLVLYCFLSRLSHSLVRSKFYLVSSRV